MAKYKNESRLGGAAAAYRTAAGLPERTSDKPTDLTKPAELEKRYEPEGGYGGKDGVRNDGALNATESARQEQRDETLEAERERIEETGLSGQETASQVAIVTGEDVTDVKPAPGTTPLETHEA
jgi:hypothetical protein